MANYMVTQHQGQLRRKPGVQASKGSQNHSQQIGKAQRYSSSPPAPRSRFRVLSVSRPAITSA